MCTATNKASPNSFYSIFESSGHICYGACLTTQSYLMKYSMGYEAVSSVAMESSSLLKDRSVLHIQSGRSRVELKENMIWHFETSDNEHVNNSSPEMSVLYKLFYFAYLIRSDRQKYKRDNGCK